MRVLPFLDAAVVLAAALMLAACGSTPKGGSAGGAPGGSSGRDGPAAEIPPDLASVPDAEPRVEPIRSGGPNKPYEVLGRSYQPETRDTPLREQGLASWYGRKFHGRKTASGELYDMHAMTAAHKTMPLPSYARVRNLSNGREVIVRVNDRGPFVAGRVIDLSYTAALKLDLLRGVGRVEVERITFDDIRTGAWRRGAPAPGEAPATAYAATVPSAAPRPSAPAPVPAVAAAPAAVGTGSPSMRDDEPAPGVAAEAGGPALNSANAATGLPADDNPGVRPLASATPGALPSGGRATAPPAAGGRGYWVQLGAFRERDGAQDFQQRVAAEMDWLAPLLAVFSDAPLWRLQAGPYASRDEAQSAAQRVRQALQLVPVIVERR